MVKQLFILIFIITLCRVGYSQTKVSGDISIDTKWTKTNSPYQIIDDITILGGAKLEIDAGVTINSAKGKRINVYGNLICLGTYEDSIHFDSCKIVANYDVRQSIKLEYCVASNSSQFFYNDYCVNTFFQHCKFYNNNNVIYNSLPGNQMHIDNCSFYNNGICIYYTGSTITNSTFYKNIIGINYANDIDTIKNCTFSENSEVAIRIDMGTVENNVITNNIIGINTLLSTATVKNNIISNNIIGVLNNASVLNFSNNQICNNQDFNFKHTYAGIIDIPNNCWCSSNIDLIKNTNSNGVNIEPITTDCNTVSIDFPMLSNANDYTIYPTLVSNFFRIKWGKQINNKINVFDHFGQLVLSKELKNSEELIDVSFLPNGFYLVLFLDNHQCCRFIKTN